MPWALAASSATQTQCLPWEATVKEVDAESIYLSRTLWVQQLWLRIDCHSYVGSVCHVSSFDGR